MKGSLLGHPLLKDLFLRHDVQVGEGRVQQVEVGVFVHGSGVGTVRQKQREKQENTLNQEA